MFRHHVIAGRSRLALYLARIPAGLGIILPLFAIGFTIVCTMCFCAAPSKLDYNGPKVPAQLSRAKPAMPPDRRRSTIPECTIERRADSGSGPSP
jgi:hypothetical protein